MVKMRKAGLLGKCRGFFKGLMRTTESTHLPLNCPLRSPPLYFAPFPPFLVNSTNSETFHKMDVSQGNA